MLEALAAFTKALLYAGALCGSGLALAALSLPLTDTLERFQLRLLRWSAAATLLASAAVAGLLIARLGEFDQVVVSAVFGSGAGAAIGLQVGGAFLLLTAAGNDAFTRVWRASNALIITLSFAFSGHAAAASPQASLLVVVHVTAAAWWVGSLIVLQRACSALEPHALRDLVVRFSSIAILVVGGLVLAGVLLSASLIDFTQANWFDEYAAGLVAKVAFALVVLGLALYNKLRLTPRLQRADRTAAAALRRSVTAELVMITAVLAATATLTTYFSPHE